MTFWQTVAATAVGSLVGTTFGFIFSIALFYLTRCWDRKILKRDLKKGFINELDRNIFQLERLVDAFKRDKQDVQEGRKGMAEIQEFILTNYHTHFYEQYLQKGFFYDDLTVGDAIRLDSVAIHLSKGQEEKLNNEVKKYRQGEGHPVSYLGLMDECILYREKEIRSLQKIRCKMTAY